MPVVLQHRVVVGLPTVPPRSKFAVGFRC